MWPEQFRPLDMYLPGCHPSRKLPITKRCSHLLSLIHSCLLSLQQFTSKAKDPILLFLWHHPVYPSHERNDCLHCSGYVQETAAIDLQKKQQKRMPKSHPERNTPTVHMDLTTMQQYFYTWLIKIHRMKVKQQIEQNTYVSHVFYSSNLLFMWQIWMIQPDRNLH